MSIIEEFLTKLLGPNYRTTISGFISAVSILAGGIALNPQGVASLPETWRPYVLSAAGTIFFVSQLYKNANTADAKNVVIPTNPTNPIMATATKTDAPVSQIRNG